MRPGGATVHLGPDAPHAPCEAALYSYLNVPHLFLFLTLLAYGLSLAFYVRFLYAGKTLTGRLGTLFLGLGLVAHYFALLERSFRTP